MKQKTPNNSPILLFDGVCNLCNYFVQFVIKRDPKAHFKFASLQSDLGQSYLDKFNLSTTDFDTVILIENGKAYTKSAVALRVARHLSGAWPLTYGLVIIPAFIRDPIYNWIARNRYKWFGKQDSCMMPEPSLKHRFLD